MTSMMMKRAALLPLLWFAMIFMPACSGDETVFYSSEAFSVYADRVEQEGFKASALGAEWLVSDYASPEAGKVHSVIEFKFSINGRDNEMGFGVNHQASIYPGEEVVLETVFGQQARLRDTIPDHLALPEETRVLFRLDLREVLAAFSRQGWYEDVHGNQIFREDFQGVFIAGSTHPLSWDFASALVFPQRGSLEWSNWGHTAPVLYSLKTGRTMFEIRLEPFNENMNMKVNDFLPDRIMISRVR